MAEAKPKTATSKKTTASKKTPSKTTTPRKPTSKTVSHTDMQEMIATNAYYRAERRGFAAGDHMQDWLDAEAEIAQKFKVKKTKA